ncbi:MAG: GerMN domain-containing protein [Cyanobacteriota bacterium]
MNKILRFTILIIILLLIAISALFIVKHTPSSSKNEINIFFSKVIGNEVVIEPIERKLIKGEDPLSRALAELIKGPTKTEKEKGFYSEIPEGTRIIEVKQTPDTVRININKQFAYGGGSNSIVGRMKELTYTALDAEPIRKVYLDIDGEEAEIIGGEGLEIIQPLSKDNFMQVTQENK